MQVTIKRKPRKRSRYAASSKIYRTKCTVYNNTLFGPTTAGIASNRSLSYKATDPVITNLKAFTIYDQYRITGIKIKFYPPVSMITAQASDPGWLLYKADPDDADSTTFTNMIADPTVKRRTLIGKPFTVFFRPRTQGAVWDPNALASTPTLSVAAVNDPKQWLDCSFKGVNYVGFKMSWSTNYQVNLSLNFDTTYYVEFKGQQAN